MDDTSKPESIPTLQRALDDLDQSTYLRIKRIAARFVRRRENPTLNATAVANEVWIRLKKSTSAPELRDAAHFDALVGQTASFIANDSARRRLSRKRFGIRAPDSELDRQSAREASLDTILQLHQALTELGREDATTAAILQDVYFEGLTVAEISTNREISRRSVERALTLGRAWLLDRLTRGANGSHEEP